MTLYFLIAADGSTVAQSVARRVRRESPQRVAQYKKTGTITAVVEGRLDAGAPWIALWSPSASGQSLIPLMPEMRVTASGTAGGQADIWIDAEVS